MHTGIRGQKESEEVRPFTSSYPAPSFQCAMPPQTIGNHSQEQRCSKGRRFHTHSAKEASKALHRFERLPLVPEHVLHLEMCMFTQLIQEGRSFYLVSMDRFALIRFATLPIWPSTAFTSDTNPLCPSASNKCPVMCRSMRDDHRGQ